eukprot:Colp12_sorted_trinity150504_noHs@21955
MVAPDELKAQRIELTAAECPINAVTVYEDSRAEIIRKVAFETDKPGRCYLVIKGVVSEWTKTDTLRIRNAKGRATILEVSTDTRIVDKNSEPKLSDAEILEKKEALNQKQVEYENQLVRVEEARNMLNTFSSKLASKPKKIGEDSSSLLPAATRFMEFYEEELKNLDAEKTELNSKLQQTIRDINSLNSKLKPRNPRHAPETATDILICFDIQASEKAESQKFSFELQYMTLKGSWTASYDVRLNSEKLDTLSVTYYGSVLNTTGEDWNNVKLALSTASPSKAGAPDDLEMLVVKARSTYQSYAKKKGGGLGIDFSSRRRTTTEGNANVEEVMEIAIAESEDQLTSSTFLIQRPTTVPSGNKPVKVTVDVLTFTPELSYLAIPSKVPHVYLKAKVTNTSTKPLLKGPVSVFSDANYIAQSSVKLTYPKEAFEIYLGADQAIKLDYSVRKFFVSEQGFINKTRTKSYTRVSKVKNTRTKPISITVIEAVPKSNTYNLKVNLTAPELNKNREGKHCKFDDDSMLTFTRTVDAGELVEFEVEYNIQWIMEENLQFRVEEGKPSGGIAYNYYSDY